MFDEGHEHARDKGHAAPDVRGAVQDQPFAASHEVVVSACPKQQPEIRGKLEACLME